MTVHFKRRVFLKILLVEIALTIILMENLLFIGEELILGVMPYFLIVIALTGMFNGCFPDFHYSIEVCDDSFTIMMPNETKYTLSKSVTITKIHFGRMILEDEKNSISIPCNKEVLEFLNRIQIKQ